MATFTGSPKDDSFTGAAKADVFRFAVADLTAKDTVVGGEGDAVDELRLLTAGVIGELKLSGVSGIELLTLANGVNKLTVGDALVSTAHGAVLKIMGGTGDDTVDGSALTGANAIDVTLGIGVDSVFGGAGGDTFRVNPAQLTTDDTIAGGAGFDTLMFSQAGTVASGRLTHVSGIEKIVLANGANTLTVNDALVSTAAGNRLTVIGGSGSDVVNGAGLTGPNGLDVTLGGGSDTVRAGATDDTFRVTAGGLDKTDTIVGGGGYNTLNITTAGKLAADALSQVSGVQQVLLADGGNNITLSAAMAQAPGASVRIEGRDGDDVVDASALGADHTVFMQSGGGKDTLTGGAAGDFFYFDADQLTSGDVVQGGAGFDRIILSSAGAVVAGGFAHVSGVTAIALDAGGNSITLTSAMLAASDFGGFYVDGNAGNDTVDASGVARQTFGINIGAGGGDDTLLGGVNDETFFFVTGALTDDDTASGGAGSDTLEIQGAGTVDFRALTKITGIETLRGDDAGHTFILGGSLTGGGGTLRVTGGVGAEVVDATALKAGASEVLMVLNAGSDDVDLGSGAGTFNLGDDADTLRIRSDNAGTISGDGGNGLDTLVIGNAGGAAFKMGALAGFEIVTLVGAGGGAADFTANDTAGLVVTGTQAGVSYTIHLGAGGQTFQGNSGADTVTGGAGADILFGAAGKDILLGAGGDDHLFGDANADDLRGAAGSDFLTGGAGADKLAGGADRDFFIYDAVSEGGDTIVDFANLAGSGASSDQLWFNGAEFGGHAAGALSAAEFQSSASDAALTGSVRFFYETDTHILRYDADGSNTASHAVVIATLNAAVGIGDIVIF